MNASKRMVSLFFASSTLLAWGIYAKTFELLFSTFGVRDSHLLGKGFTMTTLVGAAAALATLFYTWRHPTVRPTINEVADELTKVVWPTWEETRNNTRVTVIVTVIIAAILWVFDQVFGHLTNMILSGGAV
jgi:preprotein translocase SecE subunit